MVLERSPEILVYHKTKQQNNKTTKNGRIEIENSNKEQIHIEGFFNCSDNLEISEKVTIKYRKITNSKL